MLIFFKYNEKFVRVAKIPDLTLSIVMRLSQKFAFAQVEFLSAKTLAQDMYIDDLETSLDEAAKSMKDFGMLEAFPAQFVQWAESRSCESKYNHYRQTHLGVSADCISMSDVCSASPNWRAY
jgi:hypothetical protein